MTLRPWSGERFSEFTKLQENPSGQVECHHDQPEGGGRCHQTGSNAGAGIDEDENAPGGEQREEQATAEMSGKLGRSDAEEMYQRFDSRCGKDEDVNGDDEIEWPAPSGMFCGATVRMH